MRFTRILALAAVVAGCSNAHGGDGVGLDMAVACMPDGNRVDCYLDPCCEVTEPAVLNRDSCTSECARGSLSCTPAPGCGSCGLSDAGPPPRCLGGPCCDLELAATRGADSCYLCPVGTASRCEPDPSARCADPTYACSEPSECVVTANTCCGECGRPTLGGSTAVNRLALSDYREGLCADPVVCPGCPSAPNPELVATCEADRCQVVDVGMEAMTACTSSDECRLRTVECCECGGTTDPWSLLAIRADAEGAYVDLVCDSDSACPECLPLYPDTVTAICEAGRCTVATAAP